MRRLPTHLQQGGEVGGGDRGEAPENTLQHGEGPPQLGTADLDGEDAGADNPIAHPDQDPDIRRYSHCLASH